MNKYKIYCYYICLLPFFIIGTALAQILSGDIFYMKERKISVDFTKRNPLEAINEERP